MTTTADLITARAELVAQLERELGLAQRPQAEIRSTCVRARALSAEGHICDVEIWALPPTDWVKMAVAHELPVWLSPAVVSAVLVGLGGLHAETDLGKLQAEVAHLREQRDHLQRACSRHELRGRIEAARAAYWQASYETECAVSGSPEEAAAYARHRTALAVLADYGVEP